MEKTAALTTETNDRKMKVMVALDDSDPSFYALSWTLSTILMPKTTAPTTTAAEGDISAHHPPEEGCLVYLVHVQQPFHNYVFPAGPGLHTGICTLIMFHFSNFKVVHNKVHAKTDNYISMNPSPNFQKPYKSMNIRKYIILTFIT